LECRRENGIGALGKCVARQYRCRSERRLVYLIVIPEGVLWGDVTAGWELGGGRMSLGDEEWL